LIPLDRDACDSSRWALGMTSPWQERRLHSCSLGTDFCSLCVAMISRKLMKAAVLALTAAAASCKNDSLDPAGGSVASVVITPSTATVAVGAIVPLTAEVLDAAGQVIPGRKVVWVSSDASIASVSSNGEVTGKKVGEVQIAASAEGKNAIAEITVNPTPVATIRLSPTNRDLLVGQTVQLVAEPLDAGGAVLPGRPVIFTTNNETAVSVSNAGLVTALAPGSAIITATSEGKSAVATVTVSIVPVASVVVTPANNPLVVGQTAQLTAEPRNAQGQPLVGRAILWTTSEPSVASVSSTGLVTAIAPGNATITATSEGKTGTATITVNPIPVASVTVAPPDPNVVIGGTIQLSATPRSSTGQVLTERAVSWGTGAPSIATVASNGTVTGVSVGTAVIFASVEGVIGTATVTVRQVPVATVTITPPTSSSRPACAMRMGRRYQTASSVGHRATTRPPPCRAAGW
jgi:uncharacterized protein YjdB